MTATLAASSVAGTPLDSGGAVVRFAHRRIYVDSLRVAVPGLLTTGSGSLGWSRGTGGALAFNFEADSLNSLDSLMSWVVGREREGGGDGNGDGDGAPGSRDMAGSWATQMSISWVWLASSAFLPVISTLGIGPSSAPTNVSSRRPCSVLLSAGSNRRATSHLIQSMS